MKFIPLIFLILPSSSWAAQYYNVGNGATSWIGEHGVCKTVANTTGSTIFVPTNTSAEWASVTTRANIAVTGRNGEQSWGGGSASFSGAPYSSNGLWCKLTWFCGNPAWRGTGSGVNVQNQWVSWSSCQDACAGGNCGSCTDANDLWQGACGENWLYERDGACNNVVVGCGPPYGD